MGFRLNGMVSFALIVAKVIVDFKPKNYKIAMGSKDCAESLQENKTFTYSYMSR